MLKMGIQDEGNVKTLKIVLTNYNPSPDHNHRPTSFLHGRLTPTTHSIEIWKPTKPYRKREGMPVIIEIIEKETCS